MKHVDAELKRLFLWARQAPNEPVEEAPLGFAGRVVARAQVAQSVALAVGWQRAISVSVWASIGLILFGSALLAAQSLRKNSPYDFTPIYQVAAERIAP